MSSKNEILSTIKNNISDRHPMPELTIDAIEFADKITQFIEICKAVGGNAVELPESENINDFIAKLFPEANTIASNLPEITIANVNPDFIDDPHDLNGTDLAIIKGELGVAENGAVWVPQNVRQKVVYFISEYLIIVLDKTKLIQNMHEAYKQIQFNEKGFGVFISGPSKTADIEQSLVVGAHGPKGLTVILV